MTSDVSQNQEVAPPRPSFYSSIIDKLRRVFSRDNIQTYAYPLIQEACRIYMQQWGQQLTQSLTNRSLAQTQAPQLSIQEMSQQMRNLSDPARLSQFVATNPELQRFVRSSPQPSVNETNVTNAANVQVIQPPERDFSNTTPVPVPNQVREITEKEIAHSASRLRMNRLGDFESDDETITSQNEQFSVFPENLLASAPAVLPAVTPTAVPTQDN